MAKIINNLISVESSKFKSRSFAHGISLVDSEINNSASAR